MPIDLRALASALLSMSMIGCALQASKDDAPPAVHAKVCSSIDVLAAPSVLFANNVGWSSQPLVVARKHAFEVFVTSPVPTAPETRVRRVEVRSDGALSMGPEITLSGRIAPAANGDGLGAITSVDGTLRLRTYDDDYRVLSDVPVAVGAAFQASGLAANGGDWFAAWYDSRSNDGRHWVTRLDADGHPLGTKQAGGGYVQVASYPGGFGWIGQLDGANMVGLDANDGARRFEPIDRPDYPLPGAVAAWPTDPHAVALAFSGHFVAMREDGSTIFEKVSISAGDGEVALASTPLGVVIGTANGARLSTRLWTEAGIAEGPVLTAAPSAKIELLAAASDGDRTFFVWSENRSSIHGAALGCRP